MIFMQMLGMHNLLGSFKVAFEH